MRTILIVVTLMALSEIGVKIGPLLAGAGVVGIALGFGARLLTGFFSRPGSWRVLDGVIAVMMVSLGTSLLAGA